MTAEKTVMFALPGQRVVLVCAAGRFKGKTFELSAGTFTIGRSPECTLCLADDQGASRVHTKIYAEGDSWFVADNDSRNGTLLNGKPVRTSGLGAGDVVTVSTCELRFSFSDDVAEPATPAQKAYSKTTLQRAQSMTTSMPAMRPAPPGPPDISGIRPAPARAAPPRGAVQERQRTSEIAVAEPPTPVSTPLPAAPPPPPKPTSPAMIIGVITGGVVCAGLVLVVGAVVWKKSRTSPSALVEIAPPLQFPPIDPRVSALGTQAVIEQPAVGVVVEEPRQVGKPVIAERPVKPVVEKPVVERPVVERPVVDKPRVDRPVVERPVVDKPVVAAVPAADWIAAFVDTGAVDVVRSRSKGTVATTAKDGDIVSAGQAVISFVGGVDGPAVVQASAAGRVDGLKVKPGDGVQKGVMLFRIVDANSKGLVRAVLPATVLPRARVGGSVELKRKRGGTTPGRVVRITGAAVVVDPGDVEAAQIESLRIL
ncbi:MAG: FHA domain-containing protein [Deltaproteobacteria bacterium]|nr:FHA domain-containing protein [Deltaproteobacteria bacterium]